VTTDRYSNKYILFFIAAAGILYNFFATFPYTMDDALITLRYSINCAKSGLPIWNQADIVHPTMGFTSPLWMLLNSIQAHFTANKDLIVIVAKYWSLIFLLFFAWLIVTIIDKQKISYSTKILFTVFFLWNPVLAFHASSGMETILFATAISIYAVLATRYSDHYKTMILLGILLFFIRPEGILALGVYWIFDLFKKKEIKKSTISALFIFLVIGIYFLIIYSYYGYPLPSAFYVKQGSGHLIKINAIKMTLVFLTLSALPFLALLAASRNGLAKNREKNIFITTLILVYLLFYLTVEPLMNVVYRYQLPILFLLMIMASGVLEDFWKQRKYIRYSIIILFIIITIFNKGLTDKYTIKVGQASKNLREIGLFLKNYRNDNGWLMYHDAGYVCYYSNLNSIDSIGLNTIDIAVKKKRKEDYLRGNEVKYYLQNSRTRSLNKIDRRNRDNIEKYGYKYVGAFPISYDGTEYYIVKLYQKNGKIDPMDLKRIKFDLTSYNTWFDTIYYYGRKLIKNR